GSGGATGGKGGSGTGGGGGGSGGGTGGGSGGSTGGAGGSKPDAGPDAAVKLDASTSEGGTPGDPGKFSFFVTSVRAMKRLSNNPMGFGGDLRYGEQTGLAGADKICTEIAESVMPGAGAKEWHAFLSAVKAGPGGTAVHAKDRIGQGPWYDKMGRLVAMTKADLLSTRPKGADPAIINDLPNEDGIPNHTDGAPGCTGNACPDNHDTLTGTSTNGMLRGTDMGSTCNDWTSSAMSGRPWCGHSWPRSGSGVNWMSALSEGGCAPGINLKEMGGPNAPTVGSGGGYGGIYCFAMKP
ncbi:MAG TPA: hypothetical protein VN914_14990, partial [Polyangia bacterium]|nr:hypothetical protein [Polyangia bacterium]